MHPSPPTSPATDVHVTDRGFVRICTRVPSLYAVSDFRRSSAYHL